MLRVQNGIMTLAIAAALTLALMGQTAVPQTGCASPADACRFFDAYLEAFNARDWNAFRATLADDVTVMFDDPAPAQRFDGRAAVEEMFSRVFPPAGTRPKQLPPPLRPTHLRAQDLGDTVVVSFELPDGDGIARRTVVLHRTEGAWRVVHIHASSRSAR